MRSIHKIKSIGEVSDEFLTHLTRLPSAVMVNEQIVSLLIWAIMKHDADALKFCDVMQMLMGDSPQELQFTESLKQGAVLF